MYLTHDRALIDHNHGRGASDWRTLLPLGGEWKSVVGKVSRSVLILWSSRVLGRGIHVSPMSGAWLRVFDAEHTKHQADI